MHMRAPMRTMAAHAKKFFISGFLQSAHVPGLSSRMPSRVWRALTAASPDAASPSDMLHTSLGALIEVRACELCCIVATSATPAACQACRCTPQKTSRTGKDACSCQQHLQLVPCHTAAASCCLDPDCPPSMDP
jgi:hypothetical protein